MVLSEVGIKDNDRSKEMSPREWVDEIAMDLTQVQIMLLPNPENQEKVGLLAPMEKFDIV